MRDKLIVGNWKMNGDLATNARLLARLSSDWHAAQGRTMAVCVPAPYLAQARAARPSALFRNRRMPKLRRQGRIPHETVDFIALSTGGSTRVNEAMRG
jgi:hypothetical protein